MVTGPFHVAPLSNWDHSSQIRGSHSCNKVLLALYFEEKGESPFPRLLELVVFDVAVSKAATAVCGSFSNRFLSSLNSEVFGVHCSLAREIGLEFVVVVVVVAVVIVIAALLTASGMLLLSRYSRGC